MDGRSCRTLIRDRIAQPKAIAVHPKRGYLYYSEWSLQPYIGRVALDGTSPLGTDDPVVKIAEKNLGWPNALAIDYYSERLFWGDAHLNEIGWIDLADGSHSRHRIPAKRTSHVASITVHEDFIYWSDWNLRQVIKAHKWSGKNESILTTTVQLPNDLRLVHPTRSFNVLILFFLKQIYQILQFISGSHAGTIHAGQITAGVHICGVLSIFKFVSKKRFSFIIFN